MANIIIYKSNNSDTFYNCKFVENKTNYEVFGCWNYSLCLQRYSKDEFKKIFDDGNKISLKQI